MHHCVLCEMDIHYTSWWIWASAIPWVLYGLTIFFGLLYYVLKAYITDQKLKRLPIPRPFSNFIGDNAEADSTAGRMLLWGLMAVVSFLLAPLTLALNFVFFWIWTLRLSKYLYRRWELKKEWERNNPKDYIPKMKNPPPPPKKMRPPKPEDIRI
jgi:hypothetical protein